MINTNQVVNEQVVEIGAQENAQEVVELTDDDESFENENDEGPAIEAAPQENADDEDDDGAEIIIIQIQIYNQMNGDAQDEAELAQLANAQDLSRINYSFLNSVEYLTEEQVNSGQYARRFEQ